MLLLFLDFPNMILFILKILISAIMIFIVFGKKQILVNMTYLYMNSVILAGFLYYLTLELSYNRSGLFYYFDEFSINYILILFTSPVVLFIYFKQNKLLREKQNLTHTVKVVFKDGEELILSGFIDSGNKLCDPVTGKNVVITSEKIKKNNPIYVPFSAVNKKGLIKCFSLKYIEINKQRFTNYLLGVSEEEINLSGSNCILSYKLMEDLNV